MNFSTEDFHNHSMAVESGNLKNILSNSKDSNGKSVNHRSGELSLKAKSIENFSNQLR